MKYSYYTYVYQLYIVCIVSGLLCLDGWKIACKRANIIAQISKTLGDLKKS